MRTVSVIGGLALFVGGLLLIALSFNDKAPANQPAPATPHLQRAASELGLPPVADERVTIARQAEIIEELSKRVKALESK